jgi:hypothetical protein
MATLTLVRWAGLARAELADQPGWVDEVLAWIQDALGTRYRARALAGLAQMMFVHLHRMPPPVSTVEPGVSSQFDAVLATGLAKDPTQRYPAAGQLAEAARAALLDTPRRAPTRPLPTARQAAAPPPRARPPVASTPRTGIAMRRAGTRRRAFHALGVDQTGAGLRLTTLLHA